MMLRFNACQYSTSSTDLSGTTEIGKEINGNGDSYEDISASELFLNRFYILNHEFENAGSSPYSLQILYKKLTSVGLLAIFLLPGQ